MDYHDLQTSKLLDVRSNSRSDVSEDEIIYAVHRVVLGNAKWYHHGVIVSDGIGATCSGLLALKKTILSDSSDAAEVTPVFLRSLMFDDTEIEQSMRDEVDEQVSALRSAGDESSYVVLGLVGDKRLTLLNVLAPDAFTAAANAAEAVNEQHGETFVPVNVSSALPILEELSSHFFTTAAAIKAMLGVPVQHGYVH